MASQATIWTATTARISEPIWIGYRFENRLIQKLRAGSRIA